MLSSFRQSSTRPRSTVLRTRAGATRRRLTGTPSGAASRSSAGHAAAAVWQPPLDGSTVPGWPGIRTSSSRRNLRLPQARDSSAIRRGVRVEDREHARRGDLLHVCAGQVRDWRPGRSGAPVRLVEPPPLTRPRSGSRGCRTGPVRRRTIGHSPGRCQASWAPIGMPAGIGPSWVCRLPATTSRRPVFRRRMQRHRTYGDDCGSNVESHTGRRFDIEGS